MAFGRQEGGCRPLESAEAPLLSVIVVVFRDRAELERVLENLSPFRGPDVEIVVIDGGSDDGSVDLLRAQDDSVDYWLSDRDSGLYDGMNRGVAAARGTFVLHINAGDRLLQLPKEELMAMRDGVEDVLSCRVAEADAGIWRPRKNWRMRFENAWHHQGTFYRRGPDIRYDTSYRVFGDFALNQKLLRAGKRAKRCDTVVAQHALGGLSNDSNAYREKLRTIRDHYGRGSSACVRVLFWLQHHYWSLVTKLR